MGKRRSRATGTPLSKALAPNDLWCADFKGEFKLTKTMKLLEFLDDFGFPKIIRWRRGRDSNPRYPCEYAAFRVRCFQPLSHLS
jgi:hypothetical protein